MNQYLDAAIKAARAAGALVRENFGRPLKVNVEEAHDIKLELDVRSQALITDYQGTRRANQYPQGRVLTISAPRSSKSLISRRMAKPVREPLCGLISPKAQVPSHCHKDDLRFKLAPLKTDRKLRVRPYRLLVEPGTRFGSTWILNLRT
jgi:hypothetical protein